MTEDRATCSPLQLVTILIVLAAASVSPLIFVFAAAGYSTLQVLALECLLPAAGAMIGAILLASAKRWKRLRRVILTGLWVGAAATAGLEVVRVIGFRGFGAMPGSLPMLIGVLLTNSFMQGPSVWSDLAGWSYHFWTGASFSVVYVLVLGPRPFWVGIIYGLARISHQTMHCP
jgi:hypothetical protein